jgi:TonB family protein
VSLPSSGTDPAAAATGPPAGAGGTAGIGGFKIDQADFKYPVYIERLVLIIGLNWFKPTQQVTTSPVVHFQILRDGTIADARIVVSSGLPFVDRAAMRAVLASSPLPPLPADYGRQDIGIQVVFD